ncbi:unnamed protein product [Staurois parvus]|uniref:Uncharacterized protein n=1 Tax=Staurois parvus TaxID=386267 RepID=A0ABN9F456_9NEOB|nr:unnamed protein product [Staurois parvus]
MILHVWDLRRGGELFCQKNGQLVHTALHGCAQHSHTKQCAYSEAQTHGPIVEHTQHS